MNGVVLQVNNLNNNETNNKNLNPIAELNQMSNDKLTIEQIYEPLGFKEPNNNNLNQICKQQEQQFKFSNQQLNKNQQTKDQLENANFNEQQMNLINNLNTFNMMQQASFKNDQIKQTYLHQTNNSSSSLINSNSKTQSNLNGQLSTQLSQYELKPVQHQYELSQEMLDKRIECLLRKYGDKAWQSAMLIQRFWRKRQMSKRFHNLALGTTHLNDITTSAQSKDTSKSVNDLNLSSNVDDQLNISSDQMDLMEVSSSEIIITDKTHPLNNGQTNTSQQKLINATLEALKTPLTDSQINNCNTSVQQTKSSMINNRSIMKRYSNASLQSTSSSGSSSNNSIPRSPTMPALAQKNIFYNSNTGSILSNCSTTAPNSTSHILLSSSPLHSNTLITNGTNNQLPHQLIYANGNNIYTTNVCLNNNSANLTNTNSFINPYFKSNQTTPTVLTPQHSLINAMSPAYLHSINNGQLNGSAMSLQSCLSNNLSRQSLLSTLSNNSLLPQHQLAKQQQIQINQYETIRKR